MKLVEIFQYGETDYVLALQGRLPPGTSMVRVAWFQTLLPADAALRHAFSLANDPAGVASLHIEGELHSLSAGDVVSVDGAAWCCTRDGWQPAEDARSGAGLTVDRLSGGRT